MNHPDRASDQWMWRPAIGRDQRIALQDRSTRFFGTDFSFEDLEERDVTIRFQITRRRERKWKIESRPRKSSQYTYSYLWIKKDNYTFVKIESVQQEGPGADDRLSEISSCQGHLDRTDRPRCTT